MVIVVSRKPRLSLGDGLFWVSLSSPGHRWTSPSSPRDLLDCKLQSGPVLASGRTGRTISNPTGPVPVPYTSKTLLDAAKEE